MSVTSHHSWKMEFARSAVYRHEQARFHEEIRRQNKEARVLRDDLGDFADFAATMVVATEIEIAAFEAELDDYRTATVESLMENERQLTEVRERLNEMLSQAYVLPDGRRVFKTEDGLRVFDEYGEELSAEEIDPDLIEDWRPHAEGYLAGRAFENELMLDREQGLQFLDRIDGAEKRLDQGDLTPEDLDEMRAELEAFAPADVARRVAGLGDQPSVSAQSDFQAASLDVQEIASPTRALDQFIPQ